MRIFKDIHKAKKDYDTGKLSRAEVAELHKNANELFKFLVEHIQRKRSRELDRSRLRLKYGEKYAELTMLENTVFIISDIESEQKEFNRAELSADGRIHTVGKSTVEEMEHVLATAKVPPKVFIKETTFEDLKKIFGADVQIMLW